MEGACRCSVGDRCWVGFSMVSALLRCASGWEGLCDGVLLCLFLAASARPLLPGHALLLLLYSGLSVAFFVAPEPWLSPLLWVVSMLLLLLSSGCSLSGAGGVMRRFVARGTHAFFALCRQSFSLPRGLFFHPRRWCGCSQTLCYALVFLTLFGYANPVIAHYVASLALFSLISVNGSSI